MGNVLRVLGIIATSMVLSLTALFLLLYSICGGFQHPGGGGWIVLGSGVIFAGGVALIVWLGRGVQAAARRPGAPGAYDPRLAVPPAGVAPAGYAAAPGYAATPPAPRAPVAPLAGTDVQWLIFLRIALGVLAFLPIAWAAMNFASFQHITAGLGLHMAAQAVFNALPPTVVLLFLLRNPPPGLGLDAAAGMSIASILFRVLFFGYTILTTPMFAQMSNMPSVFLRLGLYTVLELAIAVMALRVRSRLGPLNPGALILAIFGFLCWEGLLQAVMQVLMRLAF
jgi:hypothetical protein